MLDKNRESNVSLRFVLALLLPFAACLVQWILWPFISPFVWFLFFPAIFFSAQIGSMAAGIAASLISVILVWFFFIPPQLFFKIEDPKIFFSMGLFIVMGVLFSHTHDRLRQANRRALAALDSAQAANEQLQDANARINDLYQKTLELDKLKTQFFSNVSHELRTPLTLILGPLNRCLADPDLKQNTLTHLNLIKRNAQLLYHHVNDLLDISKIEAGWKEVRYSQVDLAHLFRVIVSHFESVAEDRSIRYNVTAPQTLSAQIDVEMLQRILLNLLSNAFKFVPDNGSIDLALEVEGDQSVITIQDNGPGVPANMCEAIFERFCQVEGHAARSHEGTGLGLSIVKEFAELLGGTITCSQAPGGGALFSLTTPLSAPQGVGVEAMQHNDFLVNFGMHDVGLFEKRTANRTESETRPGIENAPLIMIVEDNRDMNDFITDILSPYYRVVSAFNGKEGLEKAIQLQPDIIIADVMMPHMTGDQMVLELRQNNKMTDVQIIMLTAKSDQELRLKLLQHGINDYLEKPFSSDELLARVDRLTAERRRTIEQLRASEIKYRALFENTLNSLARCRVIFENNIPVDYEYIDVNPAFVKMTGLKDVMGKKISEIIPGYCLENPEVLKNFGQVVTTGKPMRWEYYLASKDMWLRYAVYSPGKDEVAVVAEDITDRKQAEVALAKSEQKYRTLADSGQALIWTSGLDKKCDYFNKSWLDFTGRTLAQELGNGWTEGVHPDDFDRCLQIYCTAFDKHEKFSMEYRLRHASGAYHWVQDDGTPRFDGEGNFLGYIGHCLDITERKRAEEEQAKLQSQLNQAQKMESVGRLAGGVAHDFNNILSVIIGYTEMALESVDPSQPLHSDLEKIFDAGKKSSNIIRQLLAFSRKQAIAPRVLDLNQTVEGMLKMLRRLIGENIELNWIPTHAQTTIKMDPSQVDQILANLCVNARDAIDNIGKVTIETKVAALDEEYCSSHVGVSPGKYAILIVSDNGKGMERDVVDKIFEPFFTTKGNAGTGLGLATVYGIAQQNNGFVNVYSEPSKGTTFKIYLPIQAGEIIQDDINSDKIKMSKGETVLFVEDDKSLLHMGITMLKKLGYKVLSTNSPKEALVLAKGSSDSIDLLLTDVIMPEMNGKELSTQLLSMHPDVKVLYVSGYTANVIAHHGIIDEGINFLQKPFSKKDLSLKIREVLDE